MGNEDTLAGFPIRQVNIILLQEYIQISQLLVMGNEDTLAGFPIRQVNIILLQVCIQISQLLVMDIKKGAINKSICFHSKTVLIDIIKNNKIYVHMPMHFKLVVLKRKKPAPSDHESN